MIHAQKLAEAYSLAGRKAYERDGVAEPILILMGEMDRGLFIQPNPKMAPTPTEACAEIIWKLGKVYPWHYIITAFETWTKSFHKDDALVRDFNKGDLSRLQAAGDREVRTCVHTYVMNIKKISESYSVSSTVVKDDPVEWDIYAYEGQGQGGMPDLMLRAYMESVDPGPELGLVPLVLIAETLIEAELASAAMVMSPEELQN